MKQKEYTFSFEKLEIWQFSKELTLKVYKLTSSFPDAERFGLTDQLRRAAVSVSSNIAEGSARKSVKDQAYMMERSFGSCTEIVCQLIIAKELNFIEGQTLSQLRLLIEELTNKLNAYVNQLRKRITE